MSAEVINLRRVRKSVARSGREAEATIARAQHGRSKGERAALVMETDRATRLLDGARREPVPPADGG